MNGIPMGIEHVVFFGALAILLLGWLTSIMLYMKILNTLKAKYPDLFRSLGHPRVFSTDKESNLKVRQFLKNGSYRDLNDPDLDKQIAQQKLFNTLFFVFVAVWIVILFFGRMFLLKG